MIQRPGVSLGTGDDLVEKILAQTLEKQQPEKHEEAKAHTEASPEKIIHETKEPSSQKKPHKPMKFDYFMDQVTVLGKVKHQRFSHHNCYSDETRDN